MQRNMDMTLIKSMDRLLEQPPVLDEDWVLALQNELEAFDPEQVTLCDVHLRQYYAHYGFTCLPDEVEYSAGTEWIVGTRLFLQYFRRRFARGTVVLMHGYTDHSGMYSGLIDHLLRRGWNVLTYDLPGHGLSAGEPLGINGFDQYVRQLQQVLNNYTPLFKGPVVMMGQSTGAAIILTLLIQSDLEQKRRWALAGSVFLAPLIRPVDYYYIRSVYKTMHWCLRRVRRRFSSNSHDADFLHFRESRDPLQHRYMAISWIGSMLKWVADIEKVGPCSDRLMVIQGTDDKTVNWRYNVAVLDHLCPAAELRLVRDARHQLVNESDEYRDKVFAHIDEFLGSCRTYKAAPSAAVIRC